MILRIFMPVKAKEKSNFFKNGKTRFLIMKLRLHQYDKQLRRLNIDERVKLKKQYKE